jgi:hypothetical protein
MVVELFTKMKIIYFSKRYEKDLNQFAKVFKYFYPKKLLLSSQEYGMDPKTGIR